MNSVAIAPAFIHASVKRRKNTWYSVKDGNWTDPTVWMSNATKRWSYPGLNITSPVFPQIGDDVYIGLGHTVTLNAGTFTIPLVVNNLYVAGTFKADNSSRTMHIRGDIQVTGSVDLTSSNLNIFLFGVNNYVTSFTSGTASTITYARIGDQPIMDLGYRNLTAANIGIKYLQGNLLTTGNVSITNGAVFEAGDYNYSAAGTTALTPGSSALTTFRKSGPGSVLFIGQLDLTLGNIVFLDFSLGNPTVELRGGMQVSFNPNTLKTGTGLWSFTTNNQSITGYGQPWDANISIVGAITLSIVTNSGGPMSVPFINGTTGSSTLLMGTGTPKLYFTTSATSMTTGIFNYTTNANVLGYNFNGSYTLPYTNYYGLDVLGTGVKTAAGSMALPGSFALLSSGYLQFGTYDLSVAGAAVITGSSDALNRTTLAKSGAGSMLFIGGLTVSGSYVTLDLTGNPSVELRGGMSFFPTIGTFNGAVTFTFTTNNQNISTAAGAWAFPYNILISGAITVTSSTPSGGLAIEGTLNGNNALSTFDNRGNTLYKNAAQPMALGVLQANAAANTWVYNLAGNQDVKGGTYRTLTLAGSGVKTLQGNVVVATLYTLSAPATLDLNGFTRT
ncbi:MAG: hypothetical protein V4594_16685 [Bacteroidota bacterium]